MPKRPSEMLGRRHGLSKSNLLHFCTCLGAHHPSVMMIANRSCSVGFSQLQQRKFDTVWKVMDRIYKIASGLTGFSGNAPNPV
jgi:hypothetical protein